MNPKFSIGKTVWRIENRAQTQATVLAVGDYDPLMGEYTYEIAYIEGGAGSWPESSLSATPPA